MSTAILNLTNFGAKAMLRQTFLLAIGVLGLAAQAQAQAILADSRAQGSAPLYYGHSSTLQEGIQHGAADMMRADGSRAFDMSRAAINFEEARDRAIKNRQQGVQQYFELQMMNRSYRRALAGKPATNDSSPATSAPAKSSSSTAAAGPSPVGTEGQIVWPAALQSPATRAARLELEQVFRLRAAGHDVRVGSSRYRQGCDAIAELATELQGSIHSLSTTEYVAAKKLLQSLKLELNQPVRQPLLSQS